MATSVLGRRETDGHGAIVPHHLIGRVLGSRKLPVREHTIDIDLRCCVIPTAHRLVRQREHRAGQTGDGLRVLDFHVAADVLQRLKRFVVQLRSGHEFIARLSGGRFSEAIAGLGHAVELRVYRSAGVLHLDWWYDSRRVEPATAQALADGFSTALMDLIRQAIAEDEMDSASDELALVDLS